MKTRAEIEAVLVKIRGVHDELVGSQGMGGKMHSHIRGKIKMLEWVLEPSGTADDGGLPWCEPCGSWHPTPRDHRHHTLLQCYRPWSDR